METEQGFQQRERMFAAGEAEGDAITRANHAETLDGFAGFAQNGFFDVHYVNDSGSGEFSVRFRFFRRAQTAAKAIATIARPSEAGSGTGASAR